jgi:hypothetical protein
MVYSLTIFSADRKRPRIQDLVYDYDAEESPSGAEASEVATLEIRAVCALVGLWQLKCHSDPVGHVRRYEMVLIKSSDIRWLIKDRDAAIPQYARTSCLELATGVDETAARAARHDMRLHSGPRDSAQNRGPVSQ